MISLSWVAPRRPLTRDPPRTATLGTNQAGIFRAYGEWAESLCSCWPTHRASRTAAASQRNEWREEVADSAQVSKLADEDITLLGEGLSELDSVSQNGSWTPRRGATTSARSVPTSPPQFAVKGLKYSEAISTVQTSSPLGATPSSAFVQQDAARVCAGDQTDIRYVHLESRRCLLRRRDRCSRSTVRTTSPNGVAGASSIAIVGSGESRAGLRTGAVGREVRGTVVRRLRRRREQFYLLPVQCRSLSRSRRRLTAVVWHDCAVHQSARTAPRSATYPANWWVRRGCRWSGGGCRCGSSAISLGRWSVLAG
jgi:hypothetical protein